MTTTVSSEATAAGGAATDTAAVVDGRMISSDSHVIESPDLWSGLLPSGFWPDGGASFMDRPGGSDPAARLEEMAMDGVAAEVLYPSLALKLFAMDDAELQAACFRRYNEWLVDFCAAAGDRVVGIGLIPVHDADRGVAEVGWIHERGLRGAQIWCKPPPHLPFAGRHHDPVFEACAEMQLPVSLHIASGFDGSKEILEAFSRDPRTLGLEAYRSPTNRKVANVADTLFDLIFSGTFDRVPELRVVFVENEIGWLPFLLDQWDYYQVRFRDLVPIDMTEKPSETFASHVYGTFFRDPVGMRMLDRWGVGNCMWSSDYPHGNSTWPRSREVVAENLGHLTPEDLEAVVRGTAAALYGIDPPPR